MVHTVYLDMDEILVDFNRGLYDALGMEYNYVTFHQVYNYFGIIGKTREEIDALCTLEFWANLKWMHDGKSILENVRYHFRAEQIYLLTHCMPNVNSSTGKMLWLQKHLPEYQPRTILLQIGVSKSQLAKPGTLLLDDKDEAVADFITAGGQGILVPRPWNRARDFANLAAEAVRGALGTLA